MQASRKIDIKSRFGDYEAAFLPNLDECLRISGDGQPFYLVDEKVFGLYRGTFESQSIKPILWPATEEKKSYHAFEELFDLLIGAGFKKNSRLVVVGGGILQDVGGFVASTLYRGVKWDLIPTTLLAQADSCIGSKTSVNLRRGKNLIGTFYPPGRVLLTPSVLSTLAAADIRSGLCEAVKLAMIEGPDHVAWMQQHLPAALDGQGLDEFLHRALMIKKRYIEEDELDRGIRNLLNYGHTFAHAFESVTNYAIPHGIAVGIGMQAAEYFSMRLGFISKAHWQDVCEVLRPLTADAATLLKKHGAGDFVKIMTSDKKNTSADITFILSRGYGQMLKKPIPVDEAQALLGDWVAGLPD